MVALSTAPHRPRKPLLGLTLKELRGQLVVVAICLWGLAAVNICVPGTRLRSGQIKGTDFLHFYVIGSLALKGDGDALYDVRAQVAQQERIVPDSRGEWFLPVYGPQVALFFAPFAILGYFDAAAVWAVVNALVYALSLFLVYRQCPNLRGHRDLVVLSALAFPPFWQLILHGQTSVLPLFAVALGFTLLQSGRTFFAGCALGLLIVKPQLALLLGLLCLARGGWKLALGVASAIGAQFVAPVIVFGVPVLRNYLRALSEAPAMASLLEPKAYQLHSLRSFFSLLLPYWNRASLGLYAISALAAALIFWNAWRSQGHPPLRYSAFLVATVLVSPHLTVYDLVLLAPAWLLFADWLAANWAHPRAPTLGGLLYLATVATMAGPLASVIRVQPSVPLLFALLVLTSDLAVEGSPPTRAVPVSLRVTRRREVDGQ